MKRIMLWSWNTVTICLTTILWTFLFEQDILEYYFKICSGRMVEFYNLRGVMNTPQSYYNFKVVPTF